MQKAEENSRSALREMRVFTAFTQKEQKTTEKERDNRMSSCDLKL